MVKGRCLCGAVSFEVDGLRPGASMCHCGMCRRTHGAPGVYSSAPAANFRFSGKENVQWCRTSHDAERGFCRLCGSKLFWREVGGAELDVTVGCLEKPTGIRIDRHIWVAHKGDYYEIADGLPLYAESSVGAQPLPPPGESAPSESGRQPETHAGGCQCGAVRYRVEGRMRDVIACHCGQCLRWHGHSPGYSAARWTQVDLQGAQFIKWLVSSDSARRGFCGTCGSSLFWEPKGKGTVSINAGTLDAPTGLRTVRQIFVADKGDYYDIDPRIEQFPDGQADKAIPF
jgi:hypothetical protein